MSSNRKPISNPFGQAPASPFPHTQPPAQPHTQPGFVQPASSNYAGGHSGVGQQFVPGPAGAANVSSRLQYMPIDERQRELEQMNSNKAFIRTTCGMFPSSTNLIQKANIPIGAVITPMAPTSTIVPVISHGNSLVIRCKRCRTYINPFIRIEGNGSWWMCNMCGVSNETPEQYVHLLAKQAIHPDPIPSAEDHIGILNGSVEFVASADYMFVIDVSAPAVNSGMLETVCSVIKSALSEKYATGAHNNRTLVGIITYDSSVHFYDLSHMNKAAKMLVISDLEDMFLPLPRGILVNLSESYQIIEGLLDGLCNTWKDSKVSGNCMGSAINAAHLVLGQVGGQMCVFTAVPPTLGEYFNKVSYKDSQQSSLVSTFKDFGTTLSQSNITVELFVCTFQPIELATLQTLTDLTAGSVHYYPSKTHHYNEKLRNELYRVLTRETGWEAVMRVRVSKGWKITGWFGHYYLRGSDLLVLPTCHGDQTFAVSFDMQESLTQDSVAYFQSALLYTNSDGERRIRIHNFAISLTGNYNELIKALDPEPCIALICHQAIRMASCSKICQQQVGGVTHETRTLAAYALGLLKSAAYRETKDVTADLRVYHWSRLQSLPMDLLASFCYPSLYPLHCLGPADPEVLPGKLELSHENLTQDGAYLLEDGESMYLWVGKGISLQWLQEVFGVQAIENLHPESAASILSAPPGGGFTPGPLGTRVREILSAVRGSRPGSYMTLNVVRQGDPLEYKFYACLVNDKSQALMLTFGEFVSKIAPKSPLAFQPASPNQAPVAPARPPQSYPGAPHAVQGFHNGRHSHPGPPPRM